MHIAEAVAHAERIAKARIESATIADVLQDEESSALSHSEQQQILKIVQERIEPRTVAQVARH